MKKYLFEGAFFMKNIYKNLIHLVLLEAVFGGTNTGPIIIKYV